MGKLSKQHPHSHTTKKENAGKENTIGITSLDISIHTKTLELYIPFWVVTIVGMRHVRREIPTRTKGKPPGIIIFLRPGNKQVHLVIVEICCFGRVYMYAYQNVCGWMYIFLFGKKIGGT